VRHRFSNDAPRFPPRQAHLRLTRDMPQHLPGDADMTGDYLQVSPSRKMADVRHLFEIGWKYGEAGRVFHSSKYKRLSFSVY
jgi:hypothetical protein